MAVCIPKHIACGWYTEDDIGFIAGPTSCSLKIIAESKSRLNIGGSFFRSKDSALLANNIQISCTWQVDDNLPASGDPANWRDYTITDPWSKIAGIKVYVKNNEFIEGPFFIKQTYNSTIPEWFSGIPLLRSTLNSSSLLIDMPDIDKKTSWDSSINDGTHLSEFSFTPLAGGQGADSTEIELKSIRTGPSYTLIYISESENNTNDGDAVQLNETRYWNGFSWILQNPTIPDCAGDPPDCGGLPTPIIIAVTSATGKVIITWTPLPNPDVPKSTYDLYKDGILVLSNIPSGVSYNTLGGIAAYIIKATNTNGSTDSNEVLARPNIIPTKVTNFAASEDKLDIVTMTFSVTEEGYPAVTYDLYKDYNNTTPVAVNITSGYEYNITGPDTSTYRIHSVNSTGEVISNSDTGSALSLPTPITNFTASDNSTNRINFTWTASSGLPTPTHDLYKDNVLFASDVPPGFSINVPGGTNTYFVRAVNLAGTTDSNPDDGTAYGLEYVTDLSATDNVADKIIITWTDPTSFPIPTYQLYANNNQVANNISSGYAFTGTPNVPYNFFVIASNLLGNRQSNTDAGIYYTLANITDLSATDNLSGRIQITWTDAAVPTPIYDLYVDGLLDTNNVLSGYNYIGTPGVTYSFYVIATNLAGTSQSNTDTGVGF